MAILSVTCVSCSFSFIVTVDFLVIFIVKLLGKERLKAYGTFFMNFFVETSTSLLLPGLFLTTRLTINLEG